MPETELDEHMALYDKWKVDSNLHISGRLKEMALQPSVPPKTPESRRVLDPQPPPKTLKLHRALNEWGIREEEWSRAFPGNITQGSLDDLVEFAQLCPWREAKTALEQAQKQFAEPRVNRRGSRLDTAVNKQIVGIAIKIIHGNHGHIEDNSSPLLKEQVDEKTIIVRDSGLSKTTVDQSIPSAEVAGHFDDPFDKLLSVAPSPEQQGYRRKRRGNNLAQDAKRPRTAHTSTSTSPQTPISRKNDASSQVGDEEGPNTSLGSTHCSSIDSSNKPSSQGFVAKLAPTGCRLASSQTQESPKSKDTKAPRQSSPDCHAITLSDDEDHGATLRCRYSVSDENLKCLRDPQGLLNDAVVNNALRILENVAGEEICVIDSQSSGTLSRLRTLAPRSKIIQPIFIEGTSHWVLGVLDGHRDFLQIHDSLPDGHHQKKAQKIALDFFGANFPHEDKPEVVYNSPIRQTDKSACGVISTAFGYHQVAGIPIPAKMDVALWRCVFLRLLMPPSEQSAQSAPACTTINLPQEATLADIPGLMRTIAKSTVSKLRQQRRSFATPNPILRVIQTIRERVLKKTEYNTDAKISEQIAEAAERLHQAEIFLVKEIPSWTSEDESLLQAISDIKMRLNG